MIVFYALIDPAVGIKNVGVTNEKTTMYTRSYGLYNGSCRSSLFYHFKKKHRHTNFFYLAKPITTTLIHGKLIAVTLTTYSIK